MSRLVISIIGAGFALAACGENKVEPAALGPPTYANIIANPAGYAGQHVEFKVGLAAGSTLFPSGETAMQLGQSWRAGDKDYSIGPASDYPPEGPCIFVVASEDKTPLIPLQPIVVDNLKPCMAGSNPLTMTGTVSDVRDVPLAFNMVDKTFKSLVLTGIDFKSPF